MIGKNEFIEIHDFATIGTDFYSRWWKKVNYSKYRKKSSRINNDTYFI